jgi:hypothetical protein
MTQLSRPYQIALLALGLFAAVWFLALRGHSTSTSGSGSSTSVPRAAPSSATTPAVSLSSSTPPPAKSAPSSVYHGSAPGVEGLTRAIAKARGAVAESERNARQLKERSAQASSSTPAGTVAPSGSSVHAAPSVSPTRSATTQAKVSGGSQTSVPHVSRVGIGSSPGMQATVERELKQGRVVTILFWNPNASVDVAVHRELHAVGAALGARVSVHDARANQVASFGTFTRAVRVYQTPTILIVDKRGKVTALTGLNDAFSIGQAIEETRHS